MCELNPKHTAIFRLEAFTSLPDMTEEEFVREVSQKLLEVEIFLNLDFKFRFHIHGPVPEKKKENEKKENKKCLSSKTQKLFKTR